MEYWISLSEANGQRATRIPSSAKNQTIMYLQEASSQRPAAGSRVCLILKTAFEIGFAFFEKRRRAFFCIGAPIAHAKAFNLDVNTGGQVGI